MRSSCAKTSCGTCSAARITSRRRATARPRSGSPSWRRRSRSSRCSFRSRSCRAWSASSSTSSASPSPRPCSSRCSSASRSTRCCRPAGTIRTSRRIAAGDSIGRVLQRFNKAFDNLHATYERGLDWALRHRWVVVAVAVVAFVSAFPILAVLGGDFMPDFNRGEYQVSFKSTPGATLRETGDRALEMVGRLRRRARRGVHLHHHRRSRIVVPARHRRIHLRQAEGKQGPAASARCCAKGAGPSRWCRD